MNHTLLSLFSGIGGLDLAAHWAGFITTRFVERDMFCQRVLTKHWPGVPIDNDIFTSHPDHADVICGGFPCQPFSIAGRRKGQEDERYLLPEMLRIVDEVKPYAVLFENVSGFPSLAHGREFKYLLRALAEMGFDAEWGHLRASYFGAPHRRERWFLVAYTERSGCAGRGECFGSKAKFEQDTAGIWASNPIEASRCGAGIPSRSSGQFKPGLVGYLNGLPSRMDCAQWPAGMGYVQHDYEPPRTIKSIANREDRIRVLGNAVVPMQAYLLFKEIHLHLDRIKEVH